MTTSSDKTSHIQAIQYLQAQLAKNKLMPALRYGRKDVQCLLNENIEITAILRMLYCYKVFSATVGVAIEITTRPSTSIGNITVSAGGNNSITINTGLTAEEVASKFYTTLKTSTNFKTNILDLEKGDVYVKGDKVWIWVKDGETLTISGLPSYITQEDISSTPKSILDQLNCLTNDQVCILLNRAYKLIN